jgi:hypothetical protein
MASFLDRFFKRSASGKGEPRGILLSEAVKLVSEEAESQISPAYPIFEKLCKSILNEAATAKEAAKAVGKGALDKAQAQYQIGMQMQRNFAERIPPALDALASPDRNYASYVRFHSTSLETVRNVAKISKDNRYLPYFLSAEIGAFGKRMNEIVRLTDELGAAIALKNEPVGWINNAQKLEKEISAQTREMTSLAELKAETEAKRKGMETEISSAIARNKETESEGGTIRQKVDSLRSQASAEKKRLTDQLSPFQRQFRKLQKRILEKELSRSLDAYIERPEEAVIGEMTSSGDYPSLKKILSEMKTALERGEIEDDQKIRARRLASIADMIGGSLASPAKRVMEIGKELAEEERLLDAAAKKTVHVDELQRRMAHFVEQIADMEKEAAAGKERIENAFVGMETLVNEATGETVRIDRNQDS